MMMSVVNCVVNLGLPLQCLNLILMWRCVLLNELFTYVHCTKSYLSKGKEANEIRCTQNNSLGL